MLNKKYRLKKNYEFNHVYKKGTSFPTRHLVLYSVKVREKEGLKIGFSVSKKLGKSVVRNRVKRILRAAARKSLPMIKKGYNYIIVARAQITNSKYIEIENSLQYALRKADKIRNSEE